MTFRRTRCAYCKAKFAPERSGQIVHAECVTAWAEAESAKRERLAAKQARMAAKAARADTRARKEAIKTLPQLLKEAQTEFNKWIRWRDRDKPCISCGRALQAEAVGGGYDCGHYRSVGSAPHLRFEEDNAHGQCKWCNRHGAGRAVDYRIGLIARIGEWMVSEIEADNEVIKLSRDEVRGIRDEYRARNLQVRYEKN